MPPADESLERRIVTVMFADLVGFTSLSEAFDAEDVAQIQDRYFAAVRDTIGRYGGRLEKFIGDAAMAAFGVPVARDDDAERAVRAGLALVHAVQDLGAQLGLEDDVLHLRVGINTGEAVVATTGTDEGRITGDTVNTAARLQTAAPPDGVFIGQTTALAVGEVADLGPQQRLELKGKADTVSARLVTGLRAEPSRERAMGALRAPTIGRAAELSDVARAVERAAGGATERWLVVAPPGVGKSRVLREAANSIAARSDVAVWRARARPGAVSTFDAIAGLLLSALGSDGGAVPEAAHIEQRLSAGGLAPARARVVAGACSALLAPQGWVGDKRQAAEDRDVLFGAWLDALNALAADVAQVWLLEDLHWAGGDVLAFVDLASARATGAGRLIVATARPSLLDKRPEWATEDAGAGRHVLRLATLEPASADELIHALVGDALPPELVARIVDGSDGNCLFIEELLRTWVSVGALLADEAGTWRLALPAEEVPLPQSVQQIYAAQLDDLPPDARRLARRASVAGRRFAVGALEPLEATRDGLEPLRRRELLTGPLAEPLLGDMYSYRHALLRDAGYASLARAERARLHARLARWLEQAAGERGGEVAEQIAGHYAAALESAPALARTVADGLDREQVRALAAHWYERAAHAAIAIAAHDAARQLLRRAIELTADDSELDLARRWQRLGEATAFAADMDEGARAYGVALELYRRALEPDRNEAAIAGMASATAALADVWYQQLRFSESRDLADSALRDLPDGDAASLARLYIARGLGAMGASGVSSDTEDDFRKAIELAATTDDTMLKHQARQAQAVLDSERNRIMPDEWLVLADEAAALGDIDGVVTSTLNAAFGSIDDAPRETKAPLARAREMALAHGLTEAAVWTTYAAAEEAFASGEWTRALELGAEVLDVGGANAYLRVTVRTIHDLVPIAAARGDLAVLRRCQDWYASLEGHFEFPDSPYARIMRPAQDLELAAFGLRSSYAPDVEGRIASYAGDPSGPSWSAALDRVLRAWLEAGELDGADRAVQSMAGYLATNAQHATHLGLGTYQLMVARVARARAENERAVAAATEALREFRTSDAPWWMAKAMRLLERSKAADSTLVAEVEAIERRLGCARPTS